jgi:nitrite reductase/ring-hydroxylating ferredoxin subunit
MTGMGFQKVARKEDLWIGEMMGLDVNGQHILLVNIDDHVYAYADACPHQKSRLSEGLLTQRILRCARHHWEFDISSGAGVNPRNTALKVFPVKIEGGDILVDTDAFLPADAIERGEER